MASAYLFVWRRGRPPPKIEEYTLYIPERRGAMICDSARSPSVLLEDALRTCPIAPCGKPYKPDGRCVTKERIVEAIEQFKLTKNVDELAGFAEATIIAQHGQAVVIHFKIEDLGGISAQEVANMAFMIKHANGARDRKRLRKSIDIMVDRIPWRCYDTVGQYIARVPRTPLGRRFGRNGRAYKMHEVRTRYEAYIETGAIGPLADCADAQIMAYPDWVGSKIIHDVDAFLSTIENAGAGIMVPANLVYLIDHVESEEIKTGLQDVLRTWSANHTVLANGAVESLTGRGPSTRAQPTHTQPAYTPAIFDTGVPATVTCEADIVD
jgi:hypothetical protein